MLCTAIQQMTMDGGDPTYFTFSYMSEPRRFLPANARIASPNTVLVTPGEDVRQESDSIYSVRFAFKEYAPANLANSNGYPVAAFRTGWVFRLGCSDVGMYF